MSLPPIGHNSGLTAFDDRIVTRFEEDLSLVLVSLDKWKKTPVTEKNAPDLKGDIDVARSRYIAIEDQRKDSKKPFMDEAKRVDKSFKGLLSDLESAGRDLKKIMADFLHTQERERQLRQAEEARIAQEKAAAARKAVEDELAAVEAGKRKMRAEEAVRIIEQKRRAEALEKASDKAEKNADRPARVNVAGHDGSRAMGLRTRLVTAIEDYETAFFEFCDEDSVRDLLVRLANRRANAKDFDREAGIPGFTITEEKSL